MTALMIEADGGQALDLALDLALDSALDLAIGRASERAAEVKAGASDVFGRAPVDEEAQWVARAIAGDATAFERLYRRHASTILGLCRRLCDGDLRRAEQAAQDAFVRAWEKLGSFRGESSFGTWMHRLTVNVVLGERRALQRWTTFEDEPEETPVSAYDPGRLDLESAIARLPKGARNILILHDVEGYRHEEIAELTGIAVGTSKAQLHRARQLMRNYLT